MSSAPSQVVFAGPEFVKRYGSVFYRWCHDNLCNNNFQYTYGVNAHPLAAADQLPMWFSTGAGIWRFLTDHGTTLCRVEIPNDAEVYVRDETAFKASKFIMSPACALCVISRDCPTFMAAMEGTAWPHPLGCTCAHARSRQPHERPAD